MFERSSGNAGDFDGLRFVVKDKVFKVHARLWFVFERKDGGGALKDTGATNTAGLSGICANYGLDCSRGSQSCQALGFAKNGDKWKDTRGGSWIDDELDLTKELLR